MVESSTDGVILGEDRVTRRQSTLTTRVSKRSLILAEDPGQSTLTTRVSKRSLILAEDPGQSTLSTRVSQGSLCADSSTDTDVIVAVLAETPASVTETLVLEETIAPVQHTEKGALSFPVSSGNTRPSLLNAPTLSTDTTGANAKPADKPAPTEDAAKPAKKPRRKLVRGGNAHKTPVLPEYTNALEALEGLEIFLGDIDISSDTETAPKPNDVNCDVNVRLDVATPTFQEVAAPVVSVLTPANKGKSKKAANPGGTIKGHFLNSELKALGLGGAAGEDSPLDKM